MVDLSNRVWNRGAPRTLSAGRRLWPLLVAATTVLLGIAGAAPLTAQEGFFERLIGALLPEKPRLEPMEVDIAPDGMAIDALNAQVLRGRAWSVVQATGPPNTPGAGDIPTAWASATQDGQVEWLELSYEKAVVPRRVVVHETFNPGALNRVVIYPEPRVDEDADDVDEVEVWKGKDPTPVDAQRGVSRIDIETVHRTKRIRIYLDSPRVAGWNEIDAVGMMDADGDLQWATSARASSTFGGGGVAMALPAGNMVQPAIIFDAEGGAKREAGLEEILADQERQMAKLVRDLKKAREEIARLRQQTEAQAKQIRELKSK